MAITSKQLYVATIIPNRGSWLEIESERDDIINANVNKLKVPISLFLGALGFTEEEVLAGVEHKEFLQTTLEKFPMQDQDASLVELNKKLRPGDPVTVEGARTALNNLFFQ